MKNSFKLLIQRFRRLSTIRIVLETVQPEILHVQQPVKPVDNIANYGFYRASICLNPGQTALIFNSDYYAKIIHAIEDQDKNQGIAYSIVLNDKSTQIIKN